MKRDQVIVRVAPWRTMQVPKQEWVDKLLEKTYEAKVRENEREREIPAKPF